MVRRAAEDETVLRHVAATELIHEFALGRTLEATLEEIVHTIHAHPTMSEAALEAVLGALGQAIHL